MSDPNRIFLNRLMQKPEAVLIWLAAYSILWVIIPIISNANLPSDTTEILAWGREWPMGVYRHPPVKIWLQEIMYQATAGWQQSAYVLSALAYAICQIAIYTTIRPVYGKDLAFACVIISPLIFYFGTYLPQWNANVAQYAFVGLLLLATWRALNSGNLLWWMIIGVASAGGIMSKYSFILLMAAVFLSAISLPALRQKISIIGIIVSFVTFVVLSAPHFFWLYQNFDIVNNYINHAVSSQPVPLGWLLGPLAAIGAWLGVAFFPYLIVRNGLFGEVDKALDTKQKNLRWIISWLAIFPSVVGLAISVFSQTALPDAWFLANFLLIPATIVLHIKGQIISGLRWNRAAQNWIFGLMLVIALIYPGERLYVAAVKDKPTAWTPIMPVAELTNFSVQYWRETHTKIGADPETPISFISGSIPAAAVINQMPNRSTQWFEHFNFNFSPWVDKNMLMRQGVLHIGEIDENLSADLNLCIVSKTAFPWHNMTGRLVKNIDILVIVPINETTQDHCLD